MMYEIQICDGLVMINMFSEIYPISTSCLLSQDDVNLEKDLWYILMIMENDLNDKLREIEEVIDIDNWN